MQPTELAFTPLRFYGRHHLIQHGLGADDVAVHAQLFRVDAEGEAHNSNSRRGAKPKPRARMSPVRSASADVMPMPARPAGCR